MLQVFEGMPVKKCCVFFFSMCPFLQKYHQEKLNEAFKNCKTEHEKKKIMNIMSNILSNQ